MERDFLGLNSKEPFAMVKEEVSSDGYKEIGFSKASGIHWPFSNKVSALPHLNTFKVALEDNKTKRVVSDSSISPGFLSISTADAFDPNQRQFMTDIPKSFNNERQGGGHFTLTAYPVQHEVHSVHNPSDVKMFPVSNHGNSVSLANPFFKNYYATSCQNIVGHTLKPQLHAGIPVTIPQTPIIPAIGSVAGVTDTCVKSSGSPTQLTIFYAGTVNVYDDITPEKAQAIMLLAGNGTSVPSNIAPPKVQAQVPSSKPIVSDASPVSQPVTTPPRSRLSSPLSVSSQSGAQSASGSTSTEEILTAKTTGIAVTPVSKMESPKIASSMGSVATTTMIPSVPQARKASLARFLEKRKERVMSAAPYSPCKKPSDTATQNPVN